MNSHQSIILKNIDNDFSFEGLNADQAQTSPLNYSHQLINDSSQLSKISILIAANFWQRSNKINQYRITKLNDQSAVMGDRKKSQPTQYL